ncbi:hypothetical protein [Kushneria phyllosphaerae]|uniref:hypothetical protein n=1 Tax=Kushneria phyllosphaerae TaxID=2100822 RepID=UPI000D55D5A3|nr:hypothetical protein [Kushneria phyllosphaerae]
MEKIHIAPWRVIEKRKKARTRQEYRHGQRHIEIDKMRPQRRRHGFYETFTPTTLGARGSACTLMLSR